MSARRPHAPLVGKAAQESSAAPDAIGQRIGLERLTQQAERARGGRAVVEAALGGAR